MIKTISGKEVHDTPDKGTYCIGRVPQDKAANVVHEVGHFSGLSSACEVIKKLAATASTASAA